MTSPAFSQGLACASQESIFLTGETGPLWRVIEGAVRLDRDSGHARQPVQLALPGDLIGIEALCCQPYQVSASAFTRCRLQPLPPPADSERAAWLQQALLQSLSRSQDMAQLRTGSVLQRLTHLLRQLGLEQAVLDAARQVTADTVRQALPPLREVALLVDAKPETVCRALAQLLPPRSRKSGPARSTPIDWAQSAPGLLSAVWGSKAAALGVAA